MNMPGSQRISGEAFAVERLREDPNLDYSTLRRQASDAGIAMQPIQYGRARKQLGLPPLQKQSLPQPTTPGPKALAPVEHADEPAAAAVADEPAHDLVAPKRKGSAAFDFLVQELRRDPNLVYGDLRQRCEERGWKIAPIMYGRAKAVLGLVPVKPRGSAKKAAAAAAATTSAPLAIPRTLKQVESVAADRFSKQLEDVRSLDQLVAVVKELDAERRRLRNLLDRIVTMIDEALG